MTRQDDTTAGRTSRPASLSAAFQALLGSGPSEEARDRLDQVRTIIGARDDDAALGLIAVYEAYLALAHRRMRSASVWMFAVLALAQLLIICLLCYGACLLVERAVSQDKEALSNVITTTAQHTCEGMYGDDTLKMAGFLYNNPNPRRIVYSLRQISNDDIYRLAGMADLTDRLTTIARLGPDQWRFILNVVASDQKGVRSR